MDRKESGAEVLKHVVRSVRAEVFRVNAVSGVDGDEMGCTIYGIDVNNSNVSDIAGLVAWRTIHIPVLSSGLSPMQSNQWTTAHGY